jgi:hypothetical protein
MSVVPARVDAGSSARWRGHRSLLRGERSGLVVRGCRSALSSCSGTLGRTRKSTRLSFRVRFRGVAPLASSFDDLGATLVSLLWLCDGGCIGKTGCTKTIQWICLLAVPQRGGERLFTFSKARLFQLIDVLNSFQT